MNDGRDCYFEFCSVMRLKALITGERWPEPEDTFDLVLAATLMRLA